MISQATQRVAAHIGPPRDDQRPARTERAPRGLCNKLGPVEGVGWSLLPEGSVTPPGRSAPDWQLWGPCGLTPEGCDEFGTSVVGSGGP
jgi:hypothetical protein